MPNIDTSKGKLRVWGDIKELVIVPCLWSPDGKIDPRNHPQPPYGYHHILTVDTDGSFSMTASLSATPNDDNGMAVAKVLSEFYGDIPIRIDRDFYTNKS